MDAPTVAWPRALWSWALERFPPVVYTLLVGLFWGSAVLVAGALAPGASWAPAAALVTWLAFLHLRIFDEHKDFSRDVVNYPDRVLSRGLLRLGTLTRLGWVVVLAEAGLAATLGWRAFAWWAFAFLFTVSMRYDHGVPRFIEHHMVLNAFTHNPIVVWLALFVQAATGAPWRWGYLWFAALASAGLLAFEFGRKIRLPAEEHPGVASYTTAAGQAGARRILALVYLGLGVAVGGLATALQHGPLLAAVAGAAVALPGLATCPGRQPAKRVELGASVSLLASLVAAGALALT